MSNKNKPPIVPLDVAKTDETREPTGEDLRFNEEANSFELDAETADSEYQHPNPYDTAAVNGEDATSMYDEANPFAADEYRGKPNELEELDGEVGNDKIVQLGKSDDQLIGKSEDSKLGVDDEGYPARDDAGGSDNPIQPKKS